MSDYPYGGNASDDPFLKFMHDDEWLYDLVDKYCQLFEGLEVQGQLAKLNLIFGMANGSAQRGVHNGVPYSTNRDSVCLHIEYLLETIYENRRLAKHPEGHKLQRYLPQFLDTDEWLMESITGYCKRKKKKTIAVKIMHPRNVDTEDKPGQHMVHLPIPDGLAPSEAAEGLKLLQRVCR
ncbi:hypothetical protein LCGC14_2805060, partial [marine sediment metagenome]